MAPHRGSSEHGPDGDPPWLGGKDRVPGSQSSSGGPSDVAPQSSPQPSSDFGDQPAPSTNPRAQDAKSTAPRSTRGRALRDDLAHVPACIARGTGLGSLAEARELIRSLQELTRTMRTVTAPDVPGTPAGGSDRPSPDEMKEMS